MDKQKSHESLTTAEITLEEFKENIKKEAEQVILTKLSKKIEELNDLIASLKKRWDLTPVHEKLNIYVPSSAHSDHSKRPKVTAKRSLGTRRNDEMPVPILENTEMVPTNRHISKLLMITKPQILELLNDSITLKMWITLMIPQYKDCKGIGAAIQQNILTDIDNIEACAKLLFQYASECCLSRADIVSKVSTFPHINDFRTAVNEIDENNYHYIRKIINEIRDLYCVMHDLITKNFDRLKNPVETNLMSI